MPENDYPVCEGCGERHPQASVEDVYNAALSIILSEVPKVVEKYADEFPLLAKAVEAGERAAAVLMREQLAKIFGGSGSSSPAKAEGAPETGFYL